MWYKDKYKRVSPACQRSSADQKASVKHSRSKSYAAVYPWKGKEERAMQDVIWQLNEGSSVSLR